jgi:hypothetical protein
MVQSWLLILGACLVLFAIGKYFQRSERAARRAGRDMLAVRGQAERDSADVMVVIHSLRGDILGAMNDLERRLSDRIAAAVRSTNEIEFLRTELQKRGERGWEIGKDVNKKTPTLYYPEQKVETRTEKERKYD